jgi:hypothetical protein
LGIWQRRGKIMTLEGWLSRTDIIGGNHLMASHTGGGQHRPPSGRALLMGCGSVGGVIGGGVLR